MAPTPQAAIPPVKTGSASYGVPGAPVPPADPDNTNGSGVTSGAGSLQEQFLIFLQKRDKKKFDEMAAAEKKILGNPNLTAVSTGAASYDVFENGKKLASVSQHGVNSEFKQPPDSKENAQDNIDTAIKSLAIYKASVNSDTVALGRKTEIERMMDAKVATQMGLKVANPPAKSLDEVNPALARQIEQTCAKMGYKGPQTAEKYSQPSTAGLVTTPSALDTPPPVDRHFVAAVTPPAVVASGPPAPAVAPKQALT